MYRTDLSEETNKSRFGSSVSAALIVRNEEEFLAECLNSIHSLVDEIVIVDTGSVDSSKDIAKNFHSRVENFAWCDDFSAARNFCIDCCKTDWIFYIDADERVVSPISGRISLVLQNNWVAANVGLKPKTGHSRYQLPRLFRRDPRIRFSGKIHETILPSLAQLITNGEGEIGQSSILIDHLGYENNQQLKYERNLPLLVAATKENPDRIFLWFHLAETLYHFGNTQEAEDACMRGLAIKRNVDQERWYADRTLLFDLLARIFIDSGKNPTELLESALLELPFSFVLKYRLATWLIVNKHFVPALKYASELSSVSNDKQQSMHLSFDKNIFSRYAIEIKIAALIGLEKYDDAAIEAIKLTDLNCS